MAQNKTSREKQETTHTPDSKSFANVQEEWLYSCAFKFLRFVIYLLSILMISLEFANLYMVAEKGAW